MINDPIDINIISTENSIIKTQNSLVEEKVALPPKDSASEEINHAVDDRANKLIKSSESAELKSEQQIFEPEIKVNHSNSLTESD